LTQPAGVAVQRPGIWQRVGFLLADLRYVNQAKAEVEQAMVQALTRLGLAELVATIPGVSVVGAGCILAETGDMSRYACARSVVKHAGLSPAEHTSGTFRGQSSVSRRGRPKLRTAAWRAVWAAMGHNQVLTDKHTALTSRAGDDRLTGGQARAACAAALLRWLYAIVTTYQPWDPAIAAGQARNPARNPNRVPVPA
jgi:transposase